MNELSIIILSIVGLVVGFGLSYFAGNKAAAAKIADAEQRKKAMLDEADKESKAIKKEKEIIFSVVYNLATCLGGFFVDE